ncbi:hypothetical protein [Arthrobacter sp. Y81]|uniref:hypothetical protein n=1 Tax=Arthrobacter sp. Y81 TaxID=2058897 RepID=UPI002157687E|nr:hypothetical protein [Arthrobacter sp. Y81]
MPEAVFTDQELVAIINGVAQNRKLQFPTAQDSARQRSGASSGSFPQVSTETTPSECIAFVPQNPFVRWADKSVNFAEGAMPMGAQSGPATTIMITLRSAEKDAIAKADFGYTDDLAARCSQFDLASTESGRISTYAVRLLAAPPVAEKQHGLMQTTKPKGPGDYGSVGLRVLAGTMSITLSLAVAEVNSEADAKPALDSMAGLAKELIDQAVTKPPTVAPPPPNSRTADDLVALFKGVTGPDGSPVALPGASVIGPVPGTSAGPSSQGPVPPCTYNDEAYYGSLLGAVLGQGQTQGASKMDYTEFSVISMPTTAAPPYPFDTRAGALRDCTTIQEDILGGSSREWSAFSQLNTTLAADSSYAVAYQLSDGTGEWHVRAGARKGTLSVEANTRTSSQDEAQATADRLAAFFGSVFSHAGL